MENQYQCMEDYPYATAYLLGFFDSTTAIFHDVYHDEKLISMIETLELQISKLQPKWLRTEMYYHGMDLKEAFIDHLEDINNMTEFQITMKLKTIVRKTKHNPVLINLVHKIGKEVLCD